MSIIRSEEIEWTETVHGERFAARRKRLGFAAGGEMLGCSLYEVPPGKTAFPYHLHHANEEAIYILSGRGRLRLDEAEHTVGEGDYIALRVGRAGAHQLINDADAPLRYLCMSTMIEPEVAEYPDSGKIGVLAGAAPGGDEKRREFFKLFHRDADTDYWDGE